MQQMQHTSKSQWDASKGVTCSRTPEKHRPDGRPLFFYLTPLLPGPSSFYQFPWKQIPHLDPDTPPPFVTTAAQFLRGSPVSVQAVGFSLKRGSPVSVHAVGSSLKRDSPVVAHAVGSSWTRGSLVSVDSSSMRGSLVSVHAVGSSLKRGSPVYVHAVGSS